MTRILLPLLLLCLSIGGGELSKKSCRYIVRFSQDIDRSQLEKQLESKGFTLLSVYEMLGKKYKEHIFLIRGRCDSEKILAEIPGLLDVETDRQKKLLDENSGESGGASLLLLLLPMPLLGLRALRSLKE